MQAVLMREFGPPGVLTLERVPAPAPGPGEVLVRVAAVEVSRTRDAATRSGRHPFSQQVALPHVLGGDCAGVIEGVGEEADAGLVGRRVAVMNTHTCGVCDACRAGREYECTRLQMLGIHRWGSYAEYTVVPVDSVHPLPDGLPLVEAAALAATGPIALEQLRAVGAREGGTLVVPGITGSLATTIAALARTLGLRVLGLTRRTAMVPDGLDVRVVGVDDGDLAAAIRDTVGGDLAGAIDNVGTPEVFDAYFPLLANGTRVVISGAIGTDGPPTLRVPVGLLYIRSLSVVGVRTATRRTTQDFWDLVRGGLRLPGNLLHEVPLPDAAAAHEAVLSGSSIGHTVLVVDGGPR